MRKYCGIIRMLICSFTRKSVWLILLSLGLLGALSFYWFASESEPYFALHMTTYFQAMLTLIFAMMGIELGREQRREHILDMVAVYSRRSAVFLWSQVLAIGFIDFIVTLLFATGCIVRLLMDNAPVLWIGQTMAYIILLYFLPCWILGVSGLFIAQRIKGRSVYFIAIALWIVTSSLNTGLFQYIKAMSIYSGGNILNIFNMGIINFNNLINVVTRAPLELPRWIARIGILSLLAGFFVTDGSRQLASTRLQKKRNGLALISVFICGIAFFAFCFQRYSVFFTRFADPNDVTMYTWSKSDLYKPGESVSLADYPSEKNIMLIHTDIDLDCTTQGIKAKVTMKAITNTQINVQSFTLYSDLIVDNVLVDGEKADFERSYDGLLVHIPGGKKANDPVTFTFCYHGYSLPIFPANETNMQLNRAFPLIPWPGINKTTIYDNYFYYNESEDFFIANWQRRDSVTYTLRYYGPGNLYTNLEAQGNHLYTGTSSNGVSLYSGMVHYKYRDVDVYVPAGLYQSARWAADAVLDAYDPLFDICKRMGTKQMPEKPISIIFIQMNYPLQELYSWGDEWEIRLLSSSSITAFTRKKYADSIEKYQASAEVAQMAAKYILSPCTGYPIDVSHSSTRNYAAWLSMYLTADSLDEGNWKSSTDMLKEDNTGKGNEFINGIAVPEIPLTHEEESWVNEILDRMRQGQNFDKPFAALYQELLQQKNITASDIVSQLYHNQGDQK